MIRSNQNSCALPPKSIPCPLCNNFVAHCLGGIIFLDLDCYEALQHAISAFNMKMVLSVTKKILLSRYVLAESWFFIKFYYFSEHVPLRFKKSIYTTGKMRCLNDNHNPCCITSFKSFILLCVKFD